jgi:hypothetical protein
MRVSSSCVGDHQALRALAHLQEVTLYKDVQSGQMVATNAA